MIESIIAKLENAIQSFDVELFKIEFEKNKEHIQSYRGANGLTLAHIASYWGAVNILCFLNENGVDLNVESDEKETPLFMAVDGGVQDAIQYLLQVGLDPNHRGYLGRSVLFNLAGSMVATNKQEIFEILISNGADINHIDNLGVPFIIYLANENRPKLLETVLPHIKNINVEDGKGRTALDYSVFYTCENGIKQRALLTSAGAKPGVGFSVDDRPFDWIMYGEDLVEKGKSQDELNIIWESAVLVQSEEEIHGEWRWEKNEPGFMEIIINLGPAGRGTYFNSGSGKGFHDPILYAVENSSLCMCKEEDVNEGCWSRVKEIRLKDHVLFLKDSGEILVYFKEKI